MILNEIIAGRRGIEAAAALDLSDVGSPMEIIRLIGEVQGNLALMSGANEHAYVLNMIEVGEPGWPTPNSVELDPEYDLKRDIFCGGIESLMRAVRVLAKGSIVSMYHTRFAINDRVLRHAAETVNSARRNLRDRISVTVDSELHALYELLKRPPRVTMVGDRELDTTKAMLDHQRLHPDEINFAGLVVPAAEVDERIHQLYPHMSRLGDQGVVVPMIKSPEGLEAMDQYGVSDRDLEYQDFEYHTGQMAASFIHMPYDANRGKTEPDYRERYCRELLRRIQSTQPDVVMLANFKLILHESLPEALEGKLVNVHPSYLPLLKGWRSENRAANLGENSEYNGFTYHLVDPELDGGPTLLQQKVHVEPYDEKEALRIGKKAYETTREETTRQRIIRAEAIYAPLVMAMVGSDAPRKIVTDLEAFTVEGRPEFIDHPAYQSQLKEEYHEWLEADESRSDVSYEDWHANHRVPYGRVLFEINDEWQTLEQIFDAEEFAEKETIAPNREYIFYVNLDKFGGNHAAMRVIGELTTAAQGKYGDRGRLIRSVSQLIQHTEHGNCFSCRFECVTDISAELERRGIPFEIIEHPVRATAKRKPSPGGSLTTADIA